MHTFSFVHNVTAAGHGMSATVADVNNEQRFQFTPVERRMGVPANLNISVDGKLVMVVAFPKDYVGNKFTYVHNKDKQFDGVFTDGDVNF